MDKPHKKSVALPLFPEIEGRPILNIMMDADNTALSVTYDNYVVQIRKSDESMYDIMANDKSGATESEEVEIKGIKYYLYSNYNNIYHTSAFSQIYYERDGYSISVLSFDQGLKLADLSRVLDEVKFVEYKFINDEAVRGRMYDKTRKITYNFRGTELELTYL